jgi:hypothetical protein
LSAGLGVTCAATQAGTGFGAIPLCGTFAGGTKWDIWARSPFILSGDHCLALKARCGARHIAQAGYLQLFYQLLLNKVPTLCKPEISKIMLKPN